MSVSIQNAEHYQWGAGCDGWHFVKSPALSIIRETVPSGCGETRHYHRKAEQFFFVLSGTATLEVDGTKHIIEEQHGFHVQAGLPHQLHNDQACNLEFLVTSVPPSHGDRIEVT